MLKVEMCKYIVCNCVSAYYVICYRNFAYYESRYYLSKRGCLELKTMLSLYFYLKYNMESPFMFH